MSLIKSLIQRLLDSRTTPEEAAHSAMPQENQVINYGSTTENPGSWTTILSFTAPKDGYAKAVVVGTGKNSAELYCGNMRVSAFAPVDNASINVVMPVRKGASVGLVSTVFRSAALYFVPSIGGGYNILVRRALSCLRALSLFSPRSSFRTNPNGSAAKHIHQRGFSSQTARQNTFLQGMVTWVSTSLTRAQITALIFTRSGRMEKSSQEKLLDSQLARAISLFQVLYPLRKVIESLSTVPSQSYGSRQRWGANSNLSTGGALC